MSIGPWVFNGFDVVVLLVVVISLIMAMSRGLLRELISIASLVLALIASLFVWGRYRFAAQDLIQPEWLADGALGAGTFLVAYMLVVFVLSGATKSLRGRNVGFLDRITGGLFGAGRGLVVAALFVMLMTADYRERKEMQDYVEELSPQEREVLAKAPPKWREMISSSEEVKLPPMFQNSTFYPLLDTIGDGLRALPFGEFKTMAQKLKDGEDLDKIFETSD